MSEAGRDRDRFYEILDELRGRVGEFRLRDCHGRMSWPSHGVYFFFEDGELRRDGATPRVVRVGTHAVSTGSKTTLWRRLSNHRGVLKTSGGNHRGSIFRLHVGGALLARGDVRLELNTWGRKGREVTKARREAERDVEQAVSDHIRAMPFLLVRADGEAGAQCDRAAIERNAIRLLSRCSASGSDADPPSPYWLGQHCPHDVVRRSALWNVRETEGRYDPNFLELLEHCARKTEPIY